MEDSCNLKLFGMWASFYAHRVQLALRLKGVQYEYIEEDLDNKSSFLLLYNPIYKKIPILLHNGRPISESFVILEYIDETWKEKYPLLPEDSYARSVIRFWCNLIDNELRMNMRSVLVKMEDGDDSAKKAAIKQIASVWNSLEGEIREGFFKEKRFLCGENIGLLDIVLGVGHQWILLLEKNMGFKLIDPVSFPCIYSWLQDFLGQEDVKATLPDIDKLLVYIKSRYSNVLNLVP